jgi:hypothetical protein
MSLPEELVAEYESVAQSAQTMTFPTRASELQEQAIRGIEQFLTGLGACRADCVRASDESAASRILSMELALAGVRSELVMWLKLKGEDPEEAWDQLIGAQNSIEAAAVVRRQLGEDATGLDNLLKKLLFVERFVFPPQMFNSVGGIVSRRECSICRRDYSDCEHIAGRAYMGQLCHTIVADFEQLHEISIVDNPADKRCRITHFSDQGMMRNKMTWRLEDRRQ